MRTILKEEGPMLSSEIVRRLMRRGVKRDAARQRVSRIRGDVKRLKGINFPNREQFLFIQSEYGDSRFLEKLSEALIETRSSYGQFLLGIKSRGGIIVDHHAPIATGLPTTRTRGHILHSNAEEQLIRFELIKKISSPEGTMMTALHYENEYSAHSRAIREVEDIFLGVLRGWLGKTGLASPGKIETRDTDGAPRVGQFCWSLSAPSYLNSILTRTKGKVINGIIVADILLGAAVNLNDIRPFLAKWDALIAQRRSTKIQPIFVGEFFEPEALRELRKRGCIVGIPATLFGEEAAAALKELVGVIENAAVRIGKDPDKVFELLSKVARLEGASLNLRGILFEFVVSHLFKEKGYWIDIRKKIRTPDGQACEIDVLAKNKREIISCECKGKGPGSLVGEDDIEDWMYRQRPRISEWIRSEDGLPSTRRFEFYSSTGFTPKAKRLIASIKKKHKKIPIAFRDGKSVVQELRENGESGLVEIFREHFLNS